MSNTPEEGSNGSKPVEIFISYAHLDDETALASEEGWITLLHRMLELRLAQLLGERPRVWRDPQMIGNAPITRSLEEKLSSAEIMISVITPRYLKSDWCQREIQAFFERFGEPTRIFKVIKTQVPLERIPEPVRDSLSYLFFRQDPDTKRVRELKPQAPEFDDRLYDLAYDLRLTIERVETHDGEEPAAGATPADGLTVFLADTTHDLEEMHERIRRELVEHGHRVLPAGELPRHRDAAVAAVEAALGESDFAIHLVGGTYGFVPEGAETSILEIQEQLSGRRAEAAGLPRLIYRPPGTECQSGRQRLFLDRLARELDVHPETEFVSTTSDELFQVLHAKLAGLVADRQDATPQANAEQPAKIYVLCDEIDLAAAEQVEDHLFDRGFEPFLPLFGIGPEAAEEDHRLNLERADAILVYQGEASDAWLRKIRYELDDVDATRKEPLRAKGIFLGPPATRHKERLRATGLTVIKSVDELQLDRLADFLEGIEGR